VRRVAIAGVALVLGLTGCGDDGGSGQPTSGVQAQDFRFAPATVRVPAGTTVEWLNSGRTDHTIKGPDFFSRAVPPGERFAHRFAKPGSYEYLCTLHPDAMRGRVVVGR
jgi:plastocyanin